MTIQEVAKLMQSDRRLVFRRSSFARDDYYGPLLTAAGEVMFAFRTHGVDIPLFVADLAADDWEVIDENLP